MSRETIAYRLKCDDCGTTEPFWMEGDSPASRGWNRDPTLQRVAAHNLAKDLCPDCTAAIRRQRTLDDLLASETPLGRQEYE